MNGSLRLSRHLWPCLVAHQLPHRSTLSRFLAALDQPTVEALRVLFQNDLFARPPFPSLGGLFDRTGGSWLVVDVDGTRQAARQRALPQTEALPAPHRRAGSGVRSRLSGLQTGRSCADPHRGFWRSKKVWPGWYECLPT